MLITNNRNCSSDVGEQSVEETGGSGCDGQSVDDHGEHGGSVVPHLSPGPAAGGHGGDPAGIAGGPSWPRELGCFEVLEIPFRSDGLPARGDILRAYRRLALLKHPDKEGGSKEAFQELVDAYEKAQELVDPRCGGSNRGYSQPAPGNFNYDIIFQIMSGLGEDADELGTRRMPHGAADDLSETQNLITSIKESMPEWHDKKLHLSKRLVIGYGISSFTVEASGEVEFALRDLLELPVTVEFGELVIINVVAMENEDLFLKPYWEELIGIWKNLNYGSLTGGEEEMAEEQRSPGFLQNLRESKVVELTAVRGKDSQSVAAVNTVKVGQLTENLMSKCLVDMRRARKEALETHGFLDELGKALFQANKDWFAHRFFLGDSARKDLILRRAHIVNQLVTDTIAQVLSKKLIDQRLISGPITSADISVVAHHNWPASPSEWRIFEPSLCLQRYHQYSLNYPIENLRKMKEELEQSGCDLNSSKAYILHVEWVLSGGKNVVLFFNNGTWRTEATEAMVASTMNSARKGGQEESYIDLFYYRQADASEEAKYAEFLIKGGAISRCEYATRIMTGSEVRNMEANTAKVILSIDVLIQPEKLSLS